MIGSKRFQMIEGETFPVVEAKGPLILGTLTIVPVPREKKEMPPLNKLEREELAVLVQCDGKRSVHEIADMLGMSIGKLLSKIQKHTSPTIAAISGRLLLTALIAEISMITPK